MLDRRGFGPVLVVLVALLVTSCQGRLPLAPQPTEKEPAVPSGLSRHSITHQGRERSYLVHRPARLPAGAPVVVVLHGGLGSAERVEQTTGFAALADRVGFVAVYPDATAPAQDPRRTAWNAGGCCGQAQQDQIDDAGFVRATIEDVVRRTGADRRRVFVTGFSNGSMLAHRLACESSEVVAAIAGYAGPPMLARCEPSRPVPVLVLHGSADRVVPYDGGGGGASVTRTPYPSVADTLRGWAHRNGCSGQDPPTPVASGARTRWTGCRAAVEHVRVDGGGHEYELRGGDDLAQVVWDFFVANAR